MRCCCSVGAISAASTICFETRPSRSRVQNGPPPGSPAFDHHAGDAQRAVELRAAARRGPRPRPRPRSSQRARNARAASPARSRRGRRRGDRAARTPRAAAAPASPIRSRCHRIDDARRSSGCTLSMFLTSTRSPAICSRLRSSAPWPPGRKRSVPSAVRNGRPSSASATVSVAGDWVESSSSKRVSGFLGGSGRSPEGVLAILGHGEVDARGTASDREPGEPLRRGAPRPVSPAVRRADGTAPGLWRDRRIPNPRARAVGRAPIADPRRARALRSPPTDRRPRSPAAGGRGSRAAVTRT